jgi:hypothetical protein
VRSCICAGLIGLLTTLLNPIKGKVVPVLKLIKHYAMKGYGEVDV